MTGQDPRPPRLEPPFDWDVLARYLAGESSAAEAEAVRRWLAEQPTRAELLRDLEQPILRLRRVPPRDLDVEGALRRVHARMESPTLHLETAITTAGSRRLLVGGWGTALRAAAVVALLVGGALLARVLLRGPIGITPTGSALATASPSYHTGVGQRDSVRLPDGTRVLLGPASTLTLAVNFSTDRVVTLRGEALFDVRHDAAHPFAVRVGSALVQDVGTRFMVVGDAGDRVRVVVTEGAVRLSSAAAPPGAAASVLLHAGDAGTVEPDGRALAQAHADATDELAWTRGVLVFRGAPVSEVATSLRRWYGIDLRVTDSTLARRHLTTSFNGESRERVLQVIALALGGHIEVHGDTAILTP